MAEENLILRMRAIGDRATARGADRVARAVDNIGDQAAQAARKVARLNRETSRTRVSLGPFSTSMRFAALAVGGFILGAEKAVPLTLALAEGIGTAGAAAGAAGAVGLTAYAQGTVAAKLGTSDLTAALGGNKQAFKRLTPEARRLYNTLSAAQDELKQTAQKGLFPGLEAGTTSALRNLPVINRIVGDTSKTLGGLARSAGAKVGSKAWGRDLADIGKTNTKVIDNLGHAGIHLAGGFKDIAHEARPLTLWLSRAARNGSKLTEEWLHNARASGRMSKFFRQGRTDLTLLASATGHLTGGVLNLFGNKDVDGTNTLRNLDLLTAKFDNWTRKVQGEPLGPELEKQMEDALGRLASFIGSHIGKAGVTAAGAFWHAFWAANVWGKGITALWLANKFGLTKTVLKGIGGLITGAGGGKGGGVVARGASPLNPLFVSVVGGPGSKIPGTPTKRFPGKTTTATEKAASRLWPALAGAGAAAIPLSFGVGAAIALQTKNTPAPGLPSRAPRTGWQVHQHGGVTAANTAAYAATPDIVIPVTVVADGKPIATATARAAQRKKSIR